MALNMSVRPGAVSTGARTTRVAGDWPPRPRSQAAPPIRSPARPDLVFQSEAGEIKKSKEVHPMLLQQFGGVYEDQQLAAVRQ